MNRHSPGGGNVQLHIAEQKIHIHLCRTVPQPGLREINACAPEYIIHIYKADHPAQIFDGIPEYIVIGNRIFYPLYIGYSFPPVSDTDQMALPRARQIRKQNLQPYSAQQGRQQNGPGCNRFQMQKFIIYDNQESYGK